MNKKTICNDSDLVLNREIHEIREKILFREELLKSLLSIEIFAPFVYFAVHY